MRTAATRAVSPDTAATEASVLLWCFWWGFLPELLDPRSFLAMAADPTESKVIWMGCAWARLARQEFSLWHRLQMFTGLRCIQPLAIRSKHWWFGACGAGPEMAGSAGRYRKLLAVLKHLEAEAALGSVDSFLAATELFAMHSEGQWLKVAGGEKGEVLADLVFKTPLGRGAVALECGCFIGYTAARLASSLRQNLGPAAAKQSSRIFSLEGDPVHTTVARHFLDRAKVAEIAEVHCGMVRDVVPLLCECFGTASTAYAFMDQKGTAFHGDLHLLEQLAVLHRVGSKVADNVLRPGAPLYCWLLHCCHPLTGCFWSLPEFLEESAGVEDWMALA